MLRSCSRRCGALLRSLGLHVAEQALEDDLRVQLHGQRKVGGGPGNGIRVSAAIALAAIARIGARILDGLLQRRQQGFLADVIGDDLVDGDAVVDIRTGGLLGLFARQEGCRHPVIRARHARRRFGRLRPQTADDYGLVHERSQRLHDGRELLGVQDASFGNPVARRSPMGDENAGETSLADCCGFAEGRLCRNHGIQQRQRQGDAYATQKRPTRYVFLSKEHCFRSPSKVYKFSKPITITT